MFLVSSNPRKLAEIRRYGLDLELRAGLDLPEVLGTPDQVALYKALAAGPGAVVEDTILIVEGVPVVDVRWTLDQLDMGITYAHAPAADWVVSLGHHDGDHIHLYRGVITGRLVRPDHVRPEAFSFDPYFIPDQDPLHRSLDLLEQVGQKDAQSARRLAVQSLVARSAVASFAIAGIPAWQGSWQEGH